MGCNTPLRDDFDRWLPRQRWLEAPVVLYVTDSRFDIDPERELPGRALRALHRVDVRRGGQVVRTIVIARLERTSDVAQTLPLHSAGAWARRPAAAMSSPSASGPGLGVVSSRSP